MNVERWKYFLVFLVLCVSGSPAVTILGANAGFIVVLAIMLLFWFLRPVNLLVKDVGIVCCFAALAFVHVMSFSSFVVQAELGFLIKLLIALLAVRLIPDFPRRFVLVMYVLSVISFIFFVPLLLGVNMQGLFAFARLPTEDAHFHVGLYNLRSEYGGLVRNMSMFWEPGAFAGYLALALFYFVADKGSLGLKRMHGLVLVAALLSTKSTTGYIALFALAFFYMSQPRVIKTFSLRLLLVPFSMLLLALVSYVAVNHISFLGEKIGSHVDSLSVLDESSKINRFGNFVYDMDWIAERPVLGWSANPDTRLSTDYTVVELASGQGNGLTGFMVRYGVLGFLLYIGFCTYAMWRLSYSWWISGFAVVLICLLLNGEQFMNFPLFMTLMFVPRIHVAAMAAVKKTRLPSVRVTLRKQRNAA